LAAAAWHYGVVSPLKSIWMFAAPHESAMADFVAEVVDFGRDLGGA
jgi:hypothetical protein